VVISEIFGQLCAYLKTDMQYPKSIKFHAVLKISSARSNLRSEQEPHTKHNQSKRANDQQNTELHDPPHFKK
jgi:uncharacterized protein YgiM (DUF1202 family)